MSVYFKPNRNKWCCKWGGKSKNFDTKEDAEAYDAQVKLETKVSGQAGERAKAELEGRTRYTGKPCGICGCVIKHTSNRKCVQCASLRQKRCYSKKPSWTNTKDLAVLYEKAAKYGWEVDHIVPLGSDLVCGLHCVDNLQLLDMELNRKKSNREWPDMP